MVINSQLQQDSVSFEPLIEGICAHKITLDDISPSLSPKQALLLMEMISERIAKKIMAEKKKLKEEKEIELWLDVKENKSKLHQLYELKNQYVQAVHFTAEMKRLEMQSNGRLLPHPAVPETPIADKKIEAMHQQYVQSQKTYYKSCGRKPQENRKRQPNIFIRLKQLALGAHGR